MESTDGRDPSDGRVLRQATERLRPTPARELYAMAARAAASADAHPLAKRTAAHCEHLADRVVRRA